MLLLDVDGPRNERGVRATNVASAPSASDAELNGRSSEPNGVDLVTLHFLADRRVLALGQVVNLGVEEQDLDRHVSPQGANQVITADRQPVAVPRHDPHREIFARRGDASCPCRSATVDAVHPVGVHVVDKRPEPVVGETFKR